MPPPLPVSPDAAPSSRPLRRGAPCQGRRGQATLLPHIPRPAARWAASRWADEPPRAAPGPAARHRRSDPLPLSPPPAPAPAPAPAAASQAVPPSPPHALRPARPPCYPAGPDPRRHFRQRTPRGNGGGACGVRGRGRSRPSRPDWWGGASMRRRAAAEAREAGRGGRGRAGAGVRAPG